MYAIKKHINKVLAAFLCACLLLSYNPAFGTAATAWAADGEPTSADLENDLSGVYATPGDLNDEMGEGTNVTLTNNEDGVVLNGGGGTSTIVQANTFTSTLEVQATEGPLKGTIEQIMAYGEKNGSYDLIVQATCSQTKDYKDYEFKWTVYEGDSETPMPEAVQKLLRDACSSSTNYPIQVEGTSNVFEQSIDVAELFSLDKQKKTGYFTNDQKYRFKCEVKLTVGDKVVGTETREIVLYTVDEDSGPTYGNTRLVDPVTGIITESDGKDGHGFLESAQLVGGFPSTGGLEDRMKSDFLEYAEEYDDKNLTDGSSTVPGKPVMPDIIATLTIGEDKQPTASGPYDIYIPIEDAWQYDPVKNPWGYKEGDPVDVLWRVSNTDEDGHALEAKVIDTKVVKDEETGKLYAKVTYNNPVDPLNPVSDKPACNGVDGKPVTADKPYTALPGVFAIGYNTKHRDPNDPNAYYTVKGVNGTTGNKGGSIEVSSPSGKYTRGDTAVVNITPDTSGVESTGYRYELKHLYFQNGEDGDKIDLLDPVEYDKLAKQGLTLDPALSCVTIGGDLAKAPWATYVLTTDFGLTGPTEVLPGGDKEKYYQLHLNVADSDSFATEGAAIKNPNNAFIRAKYQTNDGTKVVWDTTDTSDGTVKVLKNGMAALTFLVHSGLNDTEWLEVKSVWTSTDGKSWTKSQTAYTLDIPDMTSDMYVCIEVGKADAGLDYDRDVTYHNVNVKIADQTTSEMPVPADCTVDPTTAIVAESQISPSSGVNIKATGPIDDVSGYYPKLYSVSYMKDGKRETAEYDLDPDNTKKVNRQNSDEWIWYPPKGIDGDVDIVVTFASMNPTPRTLTVWTNGHGGASLVDGPTMLEGKKTYTLVDGKATVGSGEPYTLLMVPDPGYRVTAVEVDGVSVTSDVVGGVYCGQMPNRDSKVEVYFGPDKTGNASATRDRTLGVYVADDALDDTGNAYGLNYIWDSSTMSTAPVRDGMTDDELDVSSISVSGTSSKWGMVNNETVVTDVEIPATSPYVLNFKGRPDGGDEHAVDKVLVVGYTKTLDDDGNLVSKTATSRKLFDPWSPATFMLDCAEWGSTLDVDVIVFFKKLAEGEEPDEPEKYVKVEVVDKTGVLKEDCPKPAGTIDVLPGGYVTITDLELDDEYYEWDEPYITITDGDGNPLPIPDDVIKKAVETGVLEIGPVPTEGDVKVNIIAKEKEPDNSPKDFKVYAAKNFTGSKEFLDGKVWVGPVSGTATEVNFSTFKKIDIGDAFTVVIEPDETPDKYTMTHVAFGTDDSVRAWTSKEPVTDATGTFNVLKFSADDPSDGSVVFEPYGNKANIPVTESNDMLKWRVEGLKTDLTVVPTFVKDGTQEEPGETDAWTVQASILTGNGSLTINYGGVGFGNEVRVEKDSETPVVINIAPAEGYRLNKVTIQRTTGNAFLDVWDWITGKNAELEDLEASVDPQGGKLILSPVDYHYKVFVEFANVVPSLLDTTTVPVNVFSDPNKGNVAPNTNVRAARDGNPQFMVYTKPNSEGYYYVVDEVLVTLHYEDASHKLDKLGDPLTVSTDQKSNPYITWQSTNNDVFTMSMHEVAKAIPAGTTLTAVDIEVKYKVGTSTTPSNPGGDGYKAKEVTITCSAEGGVVSPLGKYSVYPYKVNGTEGEWAEFLVVVSAAEGYGLKGLTVKRNGEDAPALAEEYLKAINGQYTSSSGCFYIQANPDDADTMKPEAINIEFVKLDKADSTYTITMQTPIELNDGGGTVVTTKPVTLPNTESFSYTIDPLDNNTSIIIKDEYLLGGTWHETTDPNAAELLDNNNCLLVHPLTVMNQVVDRRITVTFDGDPDASDDKASPITNPNDLVNIKLTVYGTDNSNKRLTISPAANLSNVIKASGSHYAYNWYYSDARVDTGYRIYCVKVNGVVKRGAETPTNGKLSTSGSFVFKEADLTQKTNTLEIYTGIFPDGVVPPAGGDLSGGFEVDFGNGGFIMDSKGQISSASGNLGGLAGLAGIAGTASLADWSSANLMGAGVVVDPNMNEAIRSGADDEELDEDDIYGDDTKDPAANLTKKYVIVPSPGYVINHVYLYNCHAYPKDNAASSWNWTKPSVVLANSPYVDDYARAYGDSWTRDIVLNYTLELDNPGTIGFMYASFRQLPTDKIPDMTDWDPTTPDHSSVLGSDNLLVEFTPASAARAVAPLMSDADFPVYELHKGTVAQGDTIAVRPHVEPNADGSGYTINFSTVEIKPDNTYTFLVGPLLPKQADESPADKLYTIDTAKMPTSVTVTAMPEKQTKSEERIVNEADETDAVLADEAATQAEPDPNLPNYYRYYMISGSANDLGIDPSGKVKIQVPLKKLASKDGNFEGLTFAPSDNTGNKYTLTAIASDGGSLTPTTTTVAGSWYGSDTTGPWEVASGTTVSFDVKADDDFRLTRLYRNTTDCLRAYGDYDGDAASGTLTFRVTANTTVEATFASKTDPSATRKITIQVEGGHGTTSPAPNTYEVEVGKAYAITFVPDSGYVPYRIWENGVESFASPTWVGYTMPASWSDQTFRVQYAVAGTTPTTGQQLVQTGQNVLNDAATGLVRTGDNPVAVACIIGVAVLAAVGVWQMRRRKATAARAAKYSVTKRQIK